MIKPSVGRIVHYFLAGQHDKPHAALLVGVNDDRNINLAVFNDDGSHFRAVDVPLLQEGDAAPEDAPYAAWMAYQLGQAARTEAAIASGPSLEPLQKQLADVAASVDGKIANFGLSLDPIFDEIAKRLASLEKQPPAPPASPAPQTEAGGATEQPPQQSA